LILRLPPQNLLSSFLRRSRKNNAYGLHWRRQPPAQPPLVFAAKPQKHTNKNYLRKYGIIA
jgi:hypothetical protein